MQILTLQVILTPAEMWGSLSYARAPEWVTNAVTGSPWHRGRNG